MLADQLVTPIIDPESGVIGGMTLKQHYAGLALHAMISNPEYREKTMEYKVKTAAQYADEMCKFLESE